MFILSTETCKNPLGMSVRAQTFTLIGGKYKHVSIG